MRLSKRQIERDCRDSAIEDIETNDLVSCVTFSAWLDEEADIEAKATANFPHREEAVVQLIVRQGTDREWIARALDKMKEMLKGQHGHTIANLGLGYDDLDSARRLPNGDVRVRNESRWLCEIAKKAKEDLAEEARSITEME